MKQKDIEARITVLENVLGALVMLATQHLPPEQRQPFAESVAQLAAAAERHHDPAGAQLLTDLHRAAVTAAR